MSNNLLEKKRIIFIDNVSSNYAETYSKNYPNAVFFTHEGDIYKDGQIYTRIKGVNPNKNTIVSEGKKMKLIVNSNNLLEFTESTQWFWYVGPNMQNEIKEEDIRDKNDSRYGWRLIDNYNPDNVNYNEVNVNPFKFDPDKNITDDNNPIFYTVKHINESDADFNEKVNNPITTVKEDIKDMYIYLPKDLVDIYSVGIYDSNNITNFITESNLINDESTEEGRYNRYFNGVEYNCYKITGRNFGVFNMAIYNRAVQDK